MLELSRGDLDVGMVAHDLDAMLHFYGEVVQLPTGKPMVLPGNGTIHRFEVGNNLVKVFEPAYECHARAIRAPIRGRRPACATSACTSSTSTR